MIWGFVGWFSTMAIGLGDIDFTANDWFDACFLGRYVEINNAVHGPVVSDGKAVHTHLFGPGDKLRDAAHAIEQAVFGVDVEVSELPWHRLDYSICTERPKREISDCKKFLYHCNEHHCIHAFPL
jgi:hypothetical protein